MPRTCHATHLPKCTPSGKGNLANCTATAWTAVKFKLATQNLHHASLSNHTPAKLHPCKMQNLPTANLQSAKLILANTAKHQTKDSRIHHHKCEYATCKYPQTCQWLSGIGFQMKYCQNSMLAYHWNATIPECKVVNNQLATRKIAKMHANWMKYRWQISNEETAKVATLQGWIYSINLEPICYFGQINVD